MTDQSDIIQPASDAAVAVVVQSADGEASERATAEIADSQARFARMTANLPGVVFQYLNRSQGTSAYTYVSEGSLEMFGLPAKTVRDDAGAFVRIIVDEDVAAFRNSVGESKTTLGNWLWEGRVRHAGSGEIRWLSAAARPDRLSDGSTVWDGVITDVTALKRAEQSAREAEAVAEALRDDAEAANLAKSQFLANMSHELRTPLNAIISYSELLSEEAEDRGETSTVTDLGKISRAGKHLLSLINEVLDLSKVEAGRMELDLTEFAAQDVIDDVVSTTESLVGKNDNRLEVWISNPLGEIRSDLTKVRQVLLNLLSNACKFTHAGTIGLTAARDADDSGRDWITFAITDSGIGMTDVQMAKLFQPFVQADASTTRKYGGTGLGLVISRRFCQLMGGDVTVSSEAGKGSTFEMRLPAIVVDPAAAPPVPAVRPPDVLVVPPAGRLVLVIHDDPAARERIRQSLVSDGFRVETAGPGEAAMAAVRRLQPDAVTLDVFARQSGAGGDDLSSDLKQDPALSAIPIVLVTLTEDAQIGYAVNVSDYITKPNDLKRLSSVMGRTDGRVPGLCSDPADDGYVLVVEDDAALREVERRALERAGWRVVEAADGEAALAEMERQTPCLIVLDLLMPNVDGFAVIEQLKRRREWQQIPVIVVTAADLAVADRDRLRGRVQDVVQKGSYPPGGLAAAVRQAVENSAIAATPV